MKTSQKIIPEPPGTTNVFGEFLWDWIENAKKMRIPFPQVADDLSNIFRGTIFGLQN